MGFGASGGGTSSTPSNTTAQVYQPQNQPAQDVNYNNILNSLIAQGYGPAGQNYGPASNAVYGGTVNNPYYDLAQGYQQGVPPTGGSLINLGNNIATNFPSQYSALSPDVAAAWAAASGGALGNTLNTGASSLINQSQNNPYYGQALSAALQAALFGGGTAQNVYGGLGPTYAGAAALPGVGQQTAQTLAGLAPQFQNQANTLTSLQGAQSALGSQVGSLMSPVEQLAQEVAGFVPQVVQGVHPLQQQQGVLAGLERPIINSAFDPQAQLYQTQQTNALNQQNVINALSGVASTPYGAGVTGQNQQLFNQNWLNQQLAREQSGASSVGGLASGVGNLGSQIGGLYGTAGNLATQAGGLYNEAAGIGGQASNIYSQAANTGLDVGSLLGQQANLATMGQNALTSGYQSGLGLLQGAGQAGAGASSLANLAGAYPSTAYTGNINTQLGQLGAGGQVGAGGINLGYGTAQYPQQTALNTAQGTLGVGSGAGQLAGLGGNLTTSPYNLSTGNAQNILQQLTGLTGLGNQQYTLPQQTLNDLQSYLQLGQSASGLSGQLGNLGYNQALTTGLSLGTGIGALTGGGGLGSFGGAAGSGLLLPGTDTALASTGAFAGGDVGTAIAGGGGGSGFLGFLGSLFGL